MTKILIIIVNYNETGTIFDCLKTLIDFNPGIRGYDLKILVVDNGSTDGSVENLKSQISNLKTKSQSSKLKELKVIRNKKNLGFAGGVNVGIREVLENGADYIFLLNPDGAVTEDTINKLIEIAHGDKRIGIVGPLILDQHKNVWSAGGIIDKKRYTAGHTFKVNGQKEADFVSGCAMLIKGEVFQEIGLFDERFFLYFEDADFCLRAKKAGFKVIFTPEVVVYHHAGKKNIRLKEYYMARNHLLFLEKHGPLMVKVREIIRLPKTIFEHLKGGQRYAFLGILDFFLRRQGQVHLQGVSPSLTWGPSTSEVK